MSELEDEQLEDEPHEDDDEYDGAPSKMLLRSLFVLLASVVAYYVLGMGTHAAVILVAFPEEARAMSRASEEEEPAKETSEPDSNDSDPVDSEPVDSDPEGESSDDEVGSEPKPVTPSAMFWGAGILIYLVAAFACGCLIGKLAPMATMGHGVFLAAILFLSSLQAKELQVFERPAWALAAYAFGVPLSVMIGTWFMLPRDLYQEPIHDETPEAEDETD